MVDLECLEGGLRFRQITAIACVVELCQAGAAEALSFGHVNYSEGVICLCRGCEAMNYPHEAQKFFRT